MKSLLATMPLIFTFGCTASLAGDWTGTLECSDDDLGDYEFDVELELEPDEDGVFVGEMRLRGKLDFEDSTIEADTTYDVEIEREEPRGEQDLEVEGECAETTTSVDGQTIESDCGDVDDLETEGKWDGADSIEVDDEDCSGELTR